MTAAFDQVAMGLDVDASVLGSVNEPDAIRVLLIDDGAIDRGFLVNELSRRGFAVQTATNAADALGHLNSDQVDVLFTDINLPGDMDGAALARRAREILPNLPVVYASARVLALAPEARVPGAIMVPKPYEPSLVGRLIAAALHDAAADAPV